MASIPQPSTAQDTTTIGRRNGLVVLSARRQQPVVEGFLLPGVEDRGLQAQFIAELRDRLILEQMPPQNGDSCFRCVVLPLLLHAFSPYPTERKPSPFPAEPGQVARYRLYLL
jgi:hypothetical protein